MIPNLRRAILGVGEIDESEEPEPVAAAPAQAPAPVRPVIDVTEILSKGIIITDIPPELLKGEVQIVNSAPAQALARVTFPTKKKPYLIGELQRMFAYLQVFLRRICSDLQFLALRKFPI